ncbi:hypothetical protein BDN72DRAFT_423336 [Pluteus cervinus]|uniref:Uncharacterized protein n=1 Tax=Pluteus cervinus TaxID=181527 RepID=A0ACD3A930_9AGAR|nr:hypothetical protein BDN72DRAFT_423336 [Pluteus cervinus]
MDLLPQEIVEAIINYADRNTIRKLALTARRYVSACRRTLFHQVHLIPDRDLSPNPGDRRTQRLVEILQKSPEVAQCIRDVLIDAGPNPSLNGSNLSRDKFLPLCIRLITSPHRVTFIAWGMSWKDLPQQLSNVLTTMIRRPTLRVCQFLVLWNIPISLFDNSEIHTLDLAEVSFTRSPEPVRFKEIRKLIRLLNLEYSISGPLSLKDSPFGGSMQPPLFDFSSLQSLVLSTRSHRNPDIGTLLVECGQSLQSLTLSGVFENRIDLSPLSRLQELTLGFLNDIDEPGFDGSQPLIATIETLNTLNITQLQRVYLCFTDDGIAMFNTETWNLLDTALLHAFQNRGLLEAITIKFNIFNPESDLNGLKPEMVKLPICRGAGLLVHSVA